MYAHWNEFIRLHPRTEALETPIEVTKEVQNGYYGNYTTTEINVVDNAWSILYVHGHDERYKTKRVWV